VAAIRRWGPGLCSLGWFGPSAGVGRANRAQTIWVGAERSCAWFLAGPQFPL